MLLWACLLLLWVLTADCFRVQIAVTEGLPLYRSLPSQTLVPRRGLIDDAKNLLSLADWRNVNIGLRDGQRSLLFRREEAGRDPPSDLSSLLEEETLLHYELHFVEAIEQRNEAQLGSFIDEKHQWESQSQEDREALLRRDYLVSRLETIRRQIAEKE